MRARLLLLFGIALCIRPSTSQTQQFRQCRDNSDCPQGARCVDTNGQDYYGNGMGRCQCTSGLYPYVGETRLTYDLGVMDQQTVSCRGNYGNIKSVTSVQTASLLIFITTAFGKNVGSYRMNASQNKPFISTRSMDFIHSQ